MSDSGRRHRNADFVQSDGSSSVGLGSSDNSTTNKGGAVRHAGNVASDRNITSKSLGTLAGASDSAGSVVVDSADTQTAAGGTFGLNLGNAQVRLVGQVNYDAATSNRNSFTVGPNSKNVMRGGASDVGVRTGIHNLAAVRTFHYAEAVRDGLWNEFGINGNRSNWEGGVPTTAASGAWDSEQNASVAGGIGNADHAASGTLGRPDQTGGEITVHHGRLGKPTGRKQDSNMVYKAKHGTTS